MWLHVHKLNGSIHFRKHLFMRRYRGIKAFDLSPKLWLRNPMPRAKGITLRPVRFEDAIKALLQTPPPPISAHQLHRMLGITYKTAWFIAHRIRHSMAPKMPLGKLLSGTVEVDETFVGGKGERKTVSQRKTPVVASVTQKNLAKCLNECVDKGAVVNTDDSGASRGTVKSHKAHHVVNHSAKEYVLKMPGGAVAHVNTCESFFSLLKRGVYGAWHHVSREHLPKYANEFAFRWNNRKVSDGKRTVEAIKA